MTAIDIVAIILAAGESKRMGKPKMLLPWETSTVLETIVHKVKSAGANAVIVVAGSAFEQIKATIGESARLVFNEKGEMLDSLQAGLREAKMLQAKSALICLGDQPQIEERCVRLICDMYRNSQYNIIVPSHQNRRGHPWLISGNLWNEIQDMKTPQTPRGFLNLHAAEIVYAETDSPSIVQDLDTPEDYLKYKP